MSEKKYILEVDERGINFGGLRAVNDFSMKIDLVEVGYLPNVDVHKRLDVRQVHQ